MTAIVLNFPRRRGSGVNAIPARPEPARIVDLATYRRSRSHRPRPLRLDLDDDDDDGGDRWAAQAHDVIDAAEALLAAGHCEEVLEFCARATDCLGRNAAELGLGDVGAVVGLTARLGELRTRASGGA
jgi:hypothetical protein